MNLDKHQLEAISQEICDVFDIYAPPVPIELMLRQPKENMWQEVDVTQLSGSFLSIKERFSPRMSLARLLVRHIATSDWGKERDIHIVLDDEDLLNSFARMLLMPSEMVEGLTNSMRNPKTMSNHFEVPESEAQERLLDLV